MLHTSLQCGIYSPVDLAFFRLVGMSNSREDSPDWLRAFQAPKHSVLTLSSDSEASQRNSPLNDDTAGVKRDSAFDESTLVESDEDQKKVSSKLSAKPINKKTPRKRLKVEGTSTKQRKTMDFNKRAGKDVTAKIEEESSEKQIEVHNPKASIWTLSSDSEPDANSGSGADKSHASNLAEKEMEHDMELFDDKNSVPKVAPKGKSPMKKKKNADHMPTVEKKMETKGDLVDVHEAERTSEKHVESCVSSNMTPLIISDKIQRSKVLVECEGGSIDLSGDVGAVGRVVVSGNPPGDREMLLDLKGTIYRTTIVPSRTFCVVSVGPSEAKIEAIMNDFIQLKPQSNVYDTETMVEGSLDGFSFGSEDETDKMPKGDKNEGAEEQTKEKPKAKSVRKTVGAQKKGKAASGKPVKKRKPQAAMKGKAKK